MPVSYFFKFVTNLSRGFRPNSELTLTDEEKARIANTKKKDYKETDTRVRKCKGEQFEVH